MTDAQRAAIAEIRNFYEAKLAELEVLHQSQTRALFDPDGLAALQAEYRRDRERLIAEREAKIEKARLPPAWNQPGATPGCGMVHLSTHHVAPQAADRPAEPSPARRRDNFERRLACQQT